VIRSGQFLGLLTNRDLMEIYRLATLTQRSSQALSRA
jgi:hypothetical protein